MSNIANCTNAVLENRPLKKSISRSFFHAILNYQKLLRRIFLKEGKIRSCLMLIAQTSEPRNVIKKYAKHRLIKYSTRTQFLNSGRVFMSLKFFLSQSLIKMCIKICTLFALEKC